MGIVLSQQPLLNIAFLGSLVQGVIYNKLLVWRSGTLSISLTPDRLTFDNAAWERMQSFVIRASREWYFEELL